jgi:hypothetical protein
MTQADQDAYRAAYAIEEKRARARREVIWHVHWRDGQMTTLSHRPPKPEPASAPERTGRGLAAQGLLI